MTTIKAIYTRVIRKVPSRKPEAPSVSDRTSRHHRAPRAITAANTSKTATLANRDGLVLEHLRLVKAIAISVHKKLPVHVDLDDLVQAGIVGLLDAANKFDADRQDVFSAYAKHRIRGAILDSLRQLDWASRDTRRKHKQVEAAKHDLTAVLLRAPTEPELAEKLGMNMDRWYAMTLDLENLGPISTDTSPKQCDDLPPLDLPSKRETQPDFICVRQELHSTLGDAIKTLPERYQRVVQLYYAEDLTMREIGGRLDINESRVSQIHKRALELMATVLTNIGIDSIHALQA
jgi:RNA polymerase sigma factor for flagellar operon FliA